MSLSTTLKPFCQAYVLVQDYWHPNHSLQRLSTQFLMLITNSLLVDCYFFALFCLGPSLCTIPQIPILPYSRRDASWVGIAFGYPTFGQLLCCVAVQRPCDRTCPSYLCSLTYRYLKTIPARYINRLSSQEILKICFVQHCGEMPGLLSSFFMAYMHLTQDHWVDSTLALPWERRSALEHQFYGVQPVCVTTITPITQNLYLVSIGWS